MKYIILFLTLFSAFSAAGQADPSSPYTLSRSFSDEQRSAEQLLLQKEYKKALKGFQKVLKKRPAYIPALRGAGACHQLLSDYEQAAQIYDKALEANPKFSRALFYETAEAHYKSGNYFMALQLFMEFDSLQHKPDSYFSCGSAIERAAETSYYSVIDRNIRACQTAMDSVQFFNIPSIKNVGDAINTAGDEYFPYLSHDQKTMYFTRRRNEGTDENLYLSHRLGENWRIAQNANNKFNTEYNEGMTTFVRDGRQMFFTACGRKGILGTCDVWKGQVRNHKVTDTGPVIGYVNSGDWDGQASINCDGTVLFFASNRPGGLGGTDIWMCEKLPDGRWDKPKNMGAPINTEGDEEAPFITNDGLTLYFSSTGHLGLGEQDIFFSKWNTVDGWGNPVNLGMPVNSPSRELGFFLSADNKTGYVASNRKGGYGGMDIYTFEMPEQLFSDSITLVEGFVTDSVLGIPVQTTVQFANRPALETDEEGRFFICIDADDALNLSVKTKEYHPYKNNYQIPAWDNKEFYEVEVKLDPLFRLPTYTGALDSDVELSISANSGKKENYPKMRHIVYFNFDEAVLDNKDMGELNEFLNDVFDGTKTVKTVSVVGFSDDIGGDTYNMILSEKRAKSVGNFLQKKGIRVDKMMIEGRGESKGGDDKKANRKVELVVSIEE